MFNMRCLLLCYLLRRHPQKWEEIWNLPPPRFPCHFVTFKLKNNSWLTHIPYYSIDAKNYKWKAKSLHSVANPLSSGEHTGCMARPPPARPPAHTSLLVWQTTHLTVGLTLLIQVGTVGTSPLSATGWSATDGRQWGCVGPHVGVLLGYWGGRDWNTCNMSFLKENW